jgi:hypothetical protein
VVVYTLQRGDMEFFNGHKIYVISKVIKFCPLVRIHLHYVFCISTLFYEITHYYLEKHYNGLSNEMVTASLNNVGIYVPRVQPCFNIVISTFTKCTKIILKKQLLLSLMSSRN